MVIAALEKLFWALLPGQHPIWLCVIPAVFGIQSEQQSNTPVFIFLSHRSVLWRVQQKFIT